MIHLWVVRVELWSASDELVPYGDLLIPERFTAVAYLDDPPLQVGVTIATATARPRCVFLSIGGEEVTARGLRRVPVGRLVRIAVGLAAQVPSGAGVAGFARDDELADAERETVGRARRWRLTDEHLCAVANLYRAAPKGPVVAVADQFGASRATAGRWVAAARNRGLLG